MGRLRRLVLSFSILVVFATICKSEVNDNSSVLIESLNERLDRVTARAERLQKQLEHRISRKFDGEDSRIVARQVANLRAPSCDDNEFYCGDDDPQCVSKLFVCDTRTDCRNGGDERACRMPFSVKDVYYGTEVFDNCVLRKPGSMTVIVKNIQSPPFYPGHPKVRVMIVINYHDEIITGSVALPSDGYYRFSERQLVISPPLDNVRRLVCHFDGVRDDVFIGDVMTMSHLNACARFRFVRV